MKLLKITDICFNYLDTEFGPELANDLKSILYLKKKIEYTDSKDKKKDEKSTPVLYANFILKKSNKILSLIKTKGNKFTDPFGYLD